MVVVVEYVLGFLCVSAGRSGGAGWTGAAAILAGPSATTANLARGVTSSCAVINVLIPALKDHGATGILEIPISKIVQ